MPDYAAPGMKVEERDRNPHPITGVSTSTAAFIGFAASGPFMPTPITSPTEYQLAFGSPNGTGFLGYAVRGFFQNGGTRCYVLRVEATVQPAASLQALESLDVSIVCSPEDNAIAGMAAALIEHCEKMRYRIAVLQVRSNGRCLSNPDFVGPGRPPCDYLSVSNCEALIFTACCLVSSMLPSLSCAR